MNKLLNILLLRYCTLYIRNQQINYSVCISFKNTLFLTIVTFSFRIRMAVTLTFVPVSLTRCTVNGATILSDDEPGSQNLDYKNIAHFFLITIHVRVYFYLKQKYPIKKHNKQYRILKTCQQKRVKSIIFILRSMYTLNR